MKTIFPKRMSCSKWYVVDAVMETLGRLATEVSKLLQGKKHLITPGVDQGNYVVILNANKIEIGGNKVKNINYITVIIKELEV